MINLHKKFVTSSLCLFFNSLVRSMTTMKYFWIFCCFSLLFNTQFSNSSYIFTQYEEGTSVCSSDSYGEYCQQRTPAIFEGKDKNYVMTLGFLNAQSDKFHDDYDMAEYGFPIFYEYNTDDSSKLKVNLIIANGKVDKKIDGRGLFYYVSLYEDKCNNARPLTSEQALSGALYMNQKYANNAYYIYKSSASTCILSIKFEDLFQGDYENKKLVQIKAQELHVIKNEVPNYIDPFFTIDPIFGTMVYLTRNGSELSAVHYKIDENNLTNFEKVFTYPMNLDEEEAFNLFERIGRPSMYINEKNLYPSFTSYGKAAFLFFAKRDIYDLSVIGFWSPKKTLEENPKFLDENDRQRHLYYLDSEYFEKGVPVSQLGSTKFSEAECSESSYLGLFIAFAVIDFLLLLGLMGAGIMAWLGLKKMKKARRLKLGSRRGKSKKQQQQSTAAALTNLDTQTITRPSAYIKGANEPGGKQAPKAAVPSAYVGTTAAKTTVLKTIE